MDDTNRVDDTTRALAAGVRRQRRQRGLTQRQLAAEMVAAGCREWTSTTVANSERQDKPRTLSVNEVAALCVALQCNLDDLLVDSPTALERLHGFSRERDSADWTVAAVDARRREIRHDLEANLAYSLGVRDVDVARVAADLYHGRDVLVERDRRLAGTPPGDPRDRAKRLGHATRAIRNEIADYLKANDLGGPDEPEPSS